MKNWLRIIPIIGLLLFGFSQTGATNSDQLENYLQEAQCPSLVVMDFNNDLLFDNCTRNIWYVSDEPSDWFYNNQNRNNYTWEEAKQVCQNKIGDFRLPYVSELMSLVKLSCRDQNGFLDYCSPVIQPGAVDKNNRQIGPSDRIYNAYYWALRKNQSEYESWPASIDLTSGRQNNPQFAADFRLKVRCILDQKDLVLESPRNWLKGGSELNLSGLPVEKFSDCDPGTHLFMNYNSDYSKAGSYCEGNIGGSCQIGADINNKADMFYWQGGRVSGDWHCGYKNLFRNY